MTIEHTADARKDKRLSKLVDALGMEGYGVYWSLVETLAASKTGTFKRAYKALGALFNTNSNVIRRVVEDFSLFAVDEKADAFYLPTTKETPTRVEYSQPKRGYTDESGYYQYVDTEYRASNARSDELAEILTIWNGLFNETNQRYRWSSLDSATMYNALETLRSGYTIDDIKTAFQIAKNDSFAWTLQSAIKATNIQLLLIKGEKGNGNGFKNELSGTSQTNAFGVDWTQYSWR